MTRESLRILREEHGSRSIMLRSLAALVERGLGNPPSDYFTALRAIFFLSTIFTKRSTIRKSLNGCFLKWQPHLRPGPMRWFCSIRIMQKAKPPRAICSTYCGRAGSSGRPDEPRLNQHAAITLPLLLSTWRWNDDSYCRKQSAA